MQFDVKALSNYRLDEARECLESAKESFSSDRFKTAANRAYYAVFNAMRAVLILDGKDYKKHSAVIAFFRKDYIKTGIFEKGFTNIIDNAYRFRHDSDYLAFYVISKSDIEKLLKKVDVFVNGVIAYLANL